MELALQRLERARVEVNEALDDLQPLGIPAVCQVEGMLVSANLGLDYATDHLDEVLGKKKDVVEEIDETHRRKIHEVQERTSAAMSDCKRYLAEASWDVEQAISGLRRQGLASSNG